MGENNDGAMNMGDMIADLNERSRSGSNSSGYSSRRFERTSSEGSSSSGGISVVQRMPNTFSKRKQNVQNYELEYKNQIFAKRPGIIGGNKIHITTNLVKLIMKKKPIVLHHYTVNTVNNTKRIKRSKGENMLMSECISQNGQVFPDKSTIFYNNDGTMLWSQKQLKIPLHGLNLSVKDADGKTIATVHIKYSSILEFSNNVGLARDKDLTVSIEKSTASEGHGIADLPDQNDSENFNLNKFRLNIKLDKAMGECIKNIKLTVSSIVPETPMMDIQLFRSVSTTKMSLIRYLMDHIYKRELNDEEYKARIENLNSYGMNESNRKRLCALLKGVTIKLNYGKGRAFRFAGLSEKPADQLKFGKNNISVAKHFETKTNGQQLQFPNLPCVLGPRFKDVDYQPVFPLEVVEVSVDIQKLDGRIAESQLSPMIRGNIHSCDRFKIKDDLAIEGTRNKSGAREVPALFGSRTWVPSSHPTLKEHFVDVDGVFLDPPNLVHNSTCYDYAGNHDGVWQVAKDESKDALEIENEKTRRKIIVPSIITIQNPLSKKCMGFDTRNFRTLMKMLEQFGQPILRRTSPPSNDSEPCLYHIGTHCQSDKQPIEKLREKLQNIKDGIKNDATLTDNNTQEAVPLIIFIFASRFKTEYNVDIKQQNTSIDIISYYGIIKQLCDGELGINCQGILLKTFESIHETSSIARNMTLKILAKIGTIHYMLERGESHLDWRTFTNEDDATLILGIRVAYPIKVAQNHDTTKKQDESIDIITNCSVVAVVGNTDHYMTKFGESVLVKKREGGWIFRIEEAVNERIVEFQNNTGKKPKHIVCYRDGVSETEFKKVLYEEKSSITRACEMFEQGYQPTLTYIALSKERNTRFCVPEQEDTQGTVHQSKRGKLVETGITTRDFFDFYLVSHSDPLGISQPNHYYVLHDDWKPNVSFWQNITYALTYACVRGKNTINKPAPVLYAELCAKRAKDRLQAIEEMKKRKENETFNPNSENEYRRLTDQIKPAQNLNGILYC